VSDVQIQITENGPYKVGFHGAMAAVMEAES
jgi:hypothetical protein